MNGFSLCDSPNKEFEMRLLSSIAAVALLAATAFNAAAGDPHDAIAAKGETVIVQLHAVGAQIYECKAEANGALGWRFREPIAALIAAGKTVGRHYAGPTWEVEGSAVVGKAVARAPGATPKDIPWLKLDITDRRGDGPLKEATTVQRIDTAGGGLDGACDKEGDLRAEPCAADYVFLRKQGE
jgi:hypothetical protein